jgi:type VI secretion system secreted protein Hcp
VGTTVDEEEVMKLKQLLAATLGAAAALAVTATLALAAGDGARTGQAGTRAGAAALEPYQTTVGYATIEGQTQGKFDATPGNPAPFSRQIRVLGFDSLLTSPHDAATGQATGQRRHAPFKLAIPLGAASVQAFKAATTGESIKSVELSLPDAGGNVYYRIKLTNARIVSVHQYHTGTADTHELEEVQFVYQKIELEDVATHRTVVDSWAGGAA